MFVSKFFLLLLGITVPAFFLLPVKWRAGVLLAASYAFCIHIEPRAFFVLVMITAFTYFTAILIERFQDGSYGKRSKRITAAAISVLVFLLCLFKYAGYLADKFGFAGRISDDVLKNFLMPVGLSFYLFQVIGYLADVYKGTSAAERNFCHLACYLSFFPKFVSGPIERADRFLPQIKRLEEVRFRNRGRMSAAFTYMLWGYFMKMVVADRLGGMVGPLFERPKNLTVFGHAWRYVVFGSNIL